MYPMMNQTMGGGLAGFAPGQNQVRQAIPVPQQGNQGMANMGAYGGQMPGGSMPYQPQQQYQQNMGAPARGGMGMGQAMNSYQQGMRQPHPGMQRNRGGLLGAAVQPTGQPMAPQPNLNNGANNGKRQIPGQQAGGNLQERILAQQGAVAPRTMQQQRVADFMGTDPAARGQMAMDRYNRVNDAANPPTQQNQMQGMMDQMQAMQQQMQQYQQPQAPQAPQQPQQPAWAGMPGFGFGGGGGGGYNPWGGMPQQPQQPQQMPWQTYRYPSQGQVGFRPGG